MSNLAFQLLAAANYIDTLGGDSRSYRAALADASRPGAEPVAAQQRFRHPQKTMPDWSPWQLCKPATRPAWEVDSEGYEVEYRALYTTPQASQPLTDEQIELAAMKPILQSIASETSPLTANEIAEAQADRGYPKTDAALRGSYRRVWSAPDAAPQASQPLTDEQIMALVDAHTYDDHGYDIWTDGRGLARAIEAAHGIGAAQDTDTQAVLIEGVAYIVPMPVAVEMLRLHLEKSKDAVDAERYRWLRRRTVIHQQMGEQTKFGRLSTLDAAIDANIAAQKGKP